ncbi:flagellar hook-length control protein FliK [Aromatoleum diolicum]|uniref:Flagellar hook-length control protein-like C-terminal domain-containing protein n=1 Tax=Aromatoleum diolicum TaxID=75796 RepID=A0ABX1QEQ4_9RHOO|nr:flagellar hook-length control protein FliK [Aromatoleum diolicum]NMG76408.1 hypothetical protein [Aromatoleum diolicum]
MSDPVLSNMLRATAPSGPAQMFQRASQENRSTGNEVTDDNFSRALERRMNAEDRPPVRPEPERAADLARTPTRAAERPRTDTTTESRRETESRPEPSAEDESKVAQTGTAEHEPATSESAGADETPSAPDQAVDPALAASLAALMPGVAALPATLAGTSTDSALTSDKLLDPDAQKSGASVLEKLIAEASGKATPGAQADNPAGGFGEQLGAFASRTSKGDAAPATGDAGALKARLQVPVLPSTSNGAALQSLPPDAQAAGLQAAAFNPGTRTEQAQVPQLPVHTPAGQRVWAEDVGNRMMWMVGRHESKAELVLTPAHLGKLEVSIQINGDQTTAHFIAATSAARDALEQAMPRLREVLQQAGINLGQANVSTSSDQRAQQDSGSGGSRPGRGSGLESAGPEGLMASTASSNWSHAGRGMVDTFA